MRWSKLKSLVERKLADSVSQRLSINSTRYGNCECGRAWLSLDGEEIANFCTRAHYRLEHENASPSIQSKKKFAKMPVDYGELSRQDAYKSCWDFVHTLSIEQALQDEDPLIQTLAVLDSRVGKKRLLNMDISAMHPLAQKLYAVRIEAEGLAVAEAKNVRD